MAENKKEVTLNRSFAYTDQKGTQHYFTKDNAGTILDVLQPDHVDAYVATGVLSVSDTQVPAPIVEPTVIPAATAEKGTGTTASHPASATSGRK